MNNVNLIGNLTRDPELRYSTGANQTAVCRFTIAVNDGYGDKQRTSFIPIVVFNKQAENCDRYLAKGRMALLRSSVVPSFSPALMDVNSSYSSREISGFVTPWFLKKLSSSLSLQARRRSSFSPIACLDKR